MSLVPSLRLWVTVYAHVCTELTQSLVKVVHLGHDCSDCDNQKDIGTRVSELVASAERKLESNTQAFDGADRDGSNGAANAEVDHRVLLAVFGRDPIDHD